MKLSLKGLSIQQQLQQQLFLILLNSQLFETSLEPLLSNRLSVSRLSESLPITYRCAIAVPLSRQLSLSPTAIAQEIFSYLSTQSYPLAPDFPQVNLRVNWVSPGWLDFQVSDRALATWLHCLEMGSLPPPNSLKMSRNPHNLFLIEYAHVRCCALLRLGEREGLIRLVSKDLTDLTWPCQDPNGIPWLMDSQQLRFTHQADFSLLNQLVMTSDRWANDASVTWTKLATQLSESILNFERYCRIFGELTQVDPQLSQGRLGLLAVSQQILKWLWFSHQADLPRSSM